MRGSKNKFKKSFLYHVLSQWVKLQNNNAFIKIKNRLEMHIVQDRFFVKSQISTIYDNEENNVKTFTDEH